VVVALKRLNAKSARTVNVRTVAKTVNASAKMTIANVLVRTLVVRRVSPNALRVRLNAITAKTVIARTVAKKVNANAKMTIATVLARIPAVRRARANAVKARAKVNVASKLNSCVR
jgi:hypothetical protein